jgi:quinol monooxygenase YgiN
MGDAMAKFATSNRIRVHPGRADDFVEVWSGLFDHYENSPDIEFYVVNQCIEDPDLVWAYELFSSREAFDNNRHSDRVEAARPTLNSFIKDGKAIFGTPVKALRFPI